MVPSNATLGPPADFSPIGWVPERRYQNVDEEVEYRRIKLDIFNFSLGYQTKVVGHINNPSSISLTNVSSAPPSPSGIRGANYSPSNTDACLPVPLGEQAIVTSKLPPYQ